MWITLGNLIGDMNASQDFQIERHVWAALKIAHLFQVGDSDSLQ